LYDVVRRFVSPLGRYTRFVTDDLSPSFIDDEVAVVGINSARSLTFKGGTLSTAQVARAAEQFQALPDHPVRIVVTHHRHRHLDPRQRRAELLFRVARRRWTSGPRPRHGRHVCLECGPPRVRGGRYAQSGQ
jgi:hypothetical protein